MRPRKFNATTTKSNISNLFSLLDKDWPVTQLQEKVATNNPRASTDDDTGALDFYATRKELAYPVGTLSTYASIPPDTQAKEGKPQDASPFPIPWAERRLAYDSRGVHIISIPNSLYIPKLEK